MIVAVRPWIQLIVSKQDAHDHRQAQSDLTGGRAAPSAGAGPRTEMKMTLSMPRTISSTVSDDEGGQDSGFVSEFHRRRITGRGVVP
jgi:hypothetical protein